MLFLALCDNVRVNSENLEKARQLLDRCRTLGAFTNVDNMVPCMDGPCLPITGEQECRARPRIVALCAAEKSPEGGLHGC